MMHSTNADRLQKEYTMLKAALAFLVLGLVSLGLNVSGIARIPIQIYWVLSVSGMVLLVTYLATRRRTRVF
jgi:uncharacterized membrane protein YtjA (UPF0391 family)